MRRKKRSVSSRKKYFKMKTGSFYLSCEFIKYVSGMRIRSRLVPNLLSGSGLNDLFLEGLKLCFYQSKNDVRVV